MHTIDIGCNTRATIRDPHKSTPPCSETFTHYYYRYIICEGIMCVCFYFRSRSCSLSCAANILYSPFSTSNDSVLFSSIFGMFHLQFLCFLFWTMVTAKTCENTDRWSHRLWPAAWWLMSTVCSLCYRVKRSRSDLRVSMCALHACICFFSSRLCTKRLIVVIMLNDRNNNYKLWFFMWIKQLLRLQNCRQLALI